MNSLINNIKPILLFVLVFFSAVWAQNNGGDKKSTTSIKMGYSIYIFQDTNPRDANAAIVLWANVLINDFHKTYNKNTALVPTIFNSLEEIEDALSKKTVDMVVLTTEEYFYLKDKYDLKPAIASIIDGDIYSQYILLTHKNSNYKTVLDLHKKNLIQPADKYNPLLLKWINKVLRDNKKPERELFFGKIHFEEKESNAIYSVFFKKTDCTIVKKNVFDVVCKLNPQIQKSLKVLETSPKLVFSLAAYRGDADVESVKLFYEVARKAHETKEGNNIIKLFKTKKLVKITENDLESTHKLFIEIPAKRKK